MAIPKGRPRAVLSLLCLHAGQVVSRDALIDALWGDRPPESAENAVQVHVSALRKALRPDDLVVRRGSGYALDVDPALIDALQFERLVEQAREARAAGRDGPAVRLFDEALALWRGPALAGLEQHAFAVRAAERLADVRVQAEEARIELELALGTHAAAIPQLERLVARIRCARACVRC